MRMVGAVVATSRTVEKCPELPRKHEERPILIMERKMGPGFNDRWENWEAKLKDEEFDRFYKHGSCALFVLKSITIIGLGVCRSFT